MPNSDGNEVERITRPLGNVIRDVGLAVAEGQRDLDETLHDTFRREGDDGPLDRETPWYRFAEVEVDLKLHFYTREEVQSASMHASARIRDAMESMEGREAVQDTAPQYGLVAAPATPSGSTFSEEELGGSSRIRFRIVPVTPPAVARREAAGENGGGGPGPGNE